MLGARQHREARASEISSNSWGSQLDAIAPSVSVAQYKGTEVILCISSKLQWVFQAHKNFPLHYQANKKHDSENWKACLYYF